MTYEEYKEKRDNLRKALRDLENEYVNSGEIKVGDIVVDEDGKEYLVRTMELFLGKITIGRISKRKKDGKFSYQYLNKYCANGQLRKKE